MASPSGLNWRERFLATVGNIGKDIYHNVTAVNGVFAYMEVTEDFVMPGGLIMDSQIWQLVPDQVAADQNLVRLNYDGNPDLGAADTCDWILGTQETDVANGAAPVRAFFIGNPASVGLGSFRAGRASGNQWDAAQRGDNSVAFGDNCEASGDNSFAVGDTCAAQGTNSVALGGQGNNAQVSTSVTVAGNGNTVDGSRCAAVGGNTNVLPFNALGSAILGGNNSTLDGTGCVIAGGLNAAINSNGGLITQNSVLAGGSGHDLGGTGQTGSTLHCGIFGGVNSRVGPLAAAAEVGPTNCVILAGASSVAHNTAASLVDSVVVAGQSASLQTDRSVIVAGASNTISSTGESCSIVGGSNNTITGNSTSSVILGGANNTVNGLDNAVIVGGNAQTLSLADEANSALLQRAVVEENCRFRAVRAVGGAVVNCDENDHVVVATNNADVTVNLPDPAGFPGFNGFELYIRNSTPANTVTVVATGTATIPGGIVTAATDQSLHFIYNLASDEWFEMNVGQ